MPKPPEVETTTPAYPAIVQYIIYREFVHQHKDAARLIRQGEPYWQYVDKRLMELYPGTGYRGMTRDAHEGARQHRAAWADYKVRRQQYLQSIEACPAEDPSCAGSSPETNPYGYEDDPSWNGQTEVEPDPYATPTLQEEIQTLRMTQPEKDEMYYYESIAWQTENGYQPVSSTSSRDELIRAAGRGRRSVSGPTIQSPWVMGTVAALGFGGYIYWRAHVARDRAEDMSAEAFPNVHRDNTQRDAHRHIFGNVMLRAYVGETITGAITNHYEQSHPNAPVGHMMDYHNNDLGRSVKYKHFRGHFFYDFLQWENWSKRVYRYVTDTRNGEYILEWDIPDPTTISWSDARNRESLVPGWKYIYFSNPAP